MFLSPRDLKPGIYPKMSMILPKVLKLTEENTCKTPNGGDVGELSPESKILKAV